MYVKGESGWKICENGEKLLFGVGFVGEGRHEPRISKKYVVEYLTWCGMLKRCYCHKNLKLQPTYQGCSVDKRWHNFQNFAEWCCGQKMSDQKGWQLDKDLLVKGNKIYSPEVCCFLPAKINSMISIERVSNGGLPIGVSRTNSKTSPYRAKAGADGYAGAYSTPEAAFNAYKIAKQASVRRAAMEHKGNLEVKVFHALMSWEV